MAIELDPLAERHGAREADEPGFALACHGKRAFAAEHATLLVQDAELGAQMRAVLERAPQLAGIGLTLARRGAAAVLFVLQGKTSAQLEAGSKPVAKHHAVAVLD
jgi:hypothetical protein